MSRKDILDDSTDISQVRSQVVTPNTGLRILARIIARDLVTKQWDNTKKKKCREVSDPQILESWR